MLEENKYGKIIDGKLIIEDSVVDIEAGAFKNNNLISVKMPDSIKRIYAFAFSVNNINSVVMSKGLINIDAYAFYMNNLTNVEIPNGVTKIGVSAFSNNKLTSLKIPSSVTILGDSSFSYNELKNVEIPNGITHIRNGTFSNNKLVNVIIPNTIISIGEFAFYANKLTSIKIPNSVNTIMVSAFRYNELTNVEIPSSVTSIGKNAFDDIDIIYDGVKISKNFIKKYGCENIIRLYNISKIISLEEVYILDKNVLETISIDVDSIKSCKINYKKYENICNMLNIDRENNKDEAKDLFKMCFCLGLFKGFISEEEMIKIIKNYSVDEIHQTWTGVKLNDYKPKYKELFLKLYEENHLEYKGRNIAGRLYNSFEKIRNHMIRKHEVDISKKNAERIRLEKEGTDVSELKKEIAYLKENIKNITYEDICYYIEHNAFDIREENEALSSVENELAIHMEQDEFDKLQDIYEASIGVTKSIPLTKDKSMEDITYHWSKSDNPVNSILGYLVDCCAKLGSSGEDIMRQSMINPDIANLIIYDENNQVLGKATAYYNKDKKYILFNNAEMKVTRELQNSSERRKACLNAILRAINDVVEEFEKQGINIAEVRIGMTRNDLKKAIKEAELEIALTNLFDNYPYIGTEGDANGKAGQAVLYRDNEERYKNKSI